MMSDMGDRRMRVRVVYRATGAAGREVEVERVIEAAGATVADAWARLSRLDPTIDPRTLEIESRPA